MENFEQGQKIKFNRPKSKGQSKSIGHKENNGGVRVKRNGEEVFLEFGTVFQVSENTSAEVANLDHSPLPLISDDWVNNSPLKSNFKIIESKSENED